MASIASPQPSVPSLTSEPTKDDTALWTASQESALLQTLLRYKPVGIHKHFRMIAIRDHLIQTGAINPEDSHTSTQGIWRKLGTLYDLEKLDEREDSVITEQGSASGSKGGSDGDDYWREFELPREDFEALMWQKRFAPDGGSAFGSSRPQSPATVTGTRRESTVAETDEGRSSPVSVSGGRGGRGRGRGARGGRLSRLQNEVESSKGSRRTSKAPSTAEVEDEVMEDADDDDEEAEDEDEEEEGSEEQEDDEEEDASTKRGPASKRGRGGRGGRGRRGRRR
jgi:MRG-binding protein